MSVSNLRELDAHEQPPEQLKAIWKYYSKIDQSKLMSSPDIDDVESAEFLTSGAISASDMREAFSKLGSTGCHDEPVNDAPIYHHPLLPGLVIVPNLITPSVQRILLSKLIHRDLSIPIHQTNLHLHYHLPYPPLPPSPFTPNSSPETVVEPITTSGTTNNNHNSNNNLTPATLPDDESSSSFFMYPPTSHIRFTPRDPTIHKPLSIKKVLDHRLRWFTLGGQYDWTNRVYPDAPPHPFPADVGRFLEKLFPQTLAQAAIVNFYTPGDTMMMHRDVSEEVNRGLVSLSMGCEALFMIAPSTEALEMGRAAGTENGGRSSSNCTERESRPVEQRSSREDATRQAKPRYRKKQHLVLRLRSGDAIYMTQEARYAWHGIPKVLKGTCPDFFQDWPATEDGKFEEWRGWMMNKRINLNVRQMN